MTRMLTLILGSFSRRNSHCSVIQTSDTVVLVECIAEPGIQPPHQRRSQDITHHLSQIFNDSASNTSSSSSSCSLDLDLNIRQMEETQRRINLTLENLIKLRHHQQHQNPVRNSRVSSECGPVSVSACRKRHSLDTIKSQGSKDCNLIADGQKNFLPREIKDQDRKIVNTDSFYTKDVTNNNAVTISDKRNSYQYPIDSPVKSKIQGLINSVKNLKNRNSVEKEEKPVFTRETRTVRTKETFSVEDFTELIRSLPANHFPRDTAEPELFNDSENTSSFQKNKTKVLHIVKEMMSSEQDYVANLSLICDDFTNFLIQSSQQLCLPDLDNLPEILQLSRQLQEDFQYRFKNWEENRKISDVFLSRSADFKVYLRYLRNFSNMNKHFDECCSKNPEFRNLSQSFEKLPACRNLKLKHFFLKPVQRLPQYKLLLTDYLKHLENEGEDYQDTLQALQMITELLKNANDVIL